MRVIYIDDEPLALQAMKKVISDYNGVTNFECFRNAYEALRYVKNNKIDVALIDIQMPEINGLELARLLKIENDEIKIIFVTSSDECALDAYKLDAIGYILKPYANEDVYKELNKASRIQGATSENRVVIRTFGYFDVFVDGKIVVFNWPKTKEILAVLVDKQGSYVSTNEMLGYLFEDQEITDSVKSYLRTLKVNLKSILSSYGVEDIILFTKNGCALKCDKIECDYYKYLKGDKKAIKSFNGEYMTNYSWAEDTLARLLMD